MQPQRLAKLFLPSGTFALLERWSLNGLPCDCGPDWSTEVIVRALQVGPHTSASNPGSIELLEEEVRSQVQAGFARVVTVSSLLQKIPPSLKVSRVAMIPQPARRDRMILDLSASVRAPPSRRTRWPSPGAILQASVNETTTPYADRTAVLQIGQVIKAYIKFLAEQPEELDIWFSKIDLSDGYWRLPISPEDAYNFAFLLPFLRGQERRCVIPSVLQMGWKDSATLFCIVTDAGNVVTMEMLKATTAKSLPAHVLESLFFPTCEMIPPPPSIPRSAISVPLLTATFIDDSMKAVAIPRGHPSRDLVLRWVTRAALHSIHSIFPPVEVTGHVGGKNPISEKKLHDGDGIWSTQKPILGWLLDGARRTIQLPADRAEKYDIALEQILSCSSVSKLAFASIHGKVQNVAQVLPSARGFLTPLNIALATKGSTIGLRPTSEVHKTLTVLRTLIADLARRPTHARELVPPALPHVYGYEDSSASGAGGVWLPCTLGMPAIVWRVCYPADIQARLSDAQKFATTNSDGEMAASILQFLVLSHVLGSLEFLSTWTGSDNTPTVRWQVKQAAKTATQTPADLCRYMACLHRRFRLGPTDFSHVHGIDNKLGDFPSRSFDLDDRSFLNQFTALFPLPLQLGSWQLVHLTPAEISPIFSILRQTFWQSQDWTAVLGDDGYFSRENTKSTPISPTYAPLRAHGIESSCHWPLLSPLGKVDTTMADLLLQRRSSVRFSSVPKSMWLRDDQIHAS